MEVIIQLTDDAAQRMQSHRASEADRELLSVLKQWNVTLRAQHPGIDDRQLSKYFVIDTDQADAAQLVTELSRVSEVDAAYVKPEEELP